jgi:hypothetical protein
MEKGQIKKGFKPFRKQIEGNNSALRNVRDCKTCKSFYRDEESEEEICHNSGVTKYDMTTEESGKTYCTYWMPDWHKD